MMQNLLLNAVFVISIIHLAATDWLDDECGTPRGAHGIRRLYPPNNNRPDWLGNMEANFKLAHFDDRNYFLGNPARMSLNHVLAWSRIRAKFNDLLRDVYNHPVRLRKVRRTRRLLQRLVNRIFRIDPDAWVDTTSTQRIHPRIPLRQRHDGNYYSYK